MASSAPLLVIASVVVVSLLAWSWKRFRDATILRPHRVRERFEIHRLLTAGWLHADAMHLLFNMVTLYFFAGEVVRSLGTAVFLAMYVGAVVVAFVPTTLRHMTDPAYASLGASGAVAAVMFSAILLRPGVELYVAFVPVPVPAPLFAVGYLAYSAWSSYRARDGVNHDAHFAGALFGSAVTYALEPARVERTVRQLAQTAAHWLR